jgi:endonuclease/exonuclease/phosphatase family metal-dependent hydrolase
MSYIVLRGRSCNIIVLNAHAPTEEKNGDSKDSFYEELEQVFDHFPKYHMKILLGDFNAITGEWKRLHNKELYALYSSPNIIRVIK